MMTWEDVPMTNNEILVIFGNKGDVAHCLFVIVGHHPKNGYFWQIPMFNKCGTSMPSKDKAKEEGIRKMKDILMICGMKLEEDATFEIVEK